MYKELFTINYTHDYFSPSGGFSMHCKLSPYSTKLSKAMDIVLVAKKGGFTVLWNDEKNTREELLKLFSGESLVVYMYPNDTDLFFNVTEDFPSHDGEEREISYPRLNFAVINGAGTKGVSINSNEAKNEAKNEIKIDCHLYPLENILYFKSICQDDKNLKSVNTLDNKAITADPELLDIYHSLKRKAFVVLVIPLDNLDKHTSEFYKLSFSAKSVQYKYYFTSLSADLTLRIEPTEQGNSDSVEFSPKDTYTLNGKKIPTFTSTRKIKLSLIPKCQYRLVTDINGTTETLIEALPQPNVDKYFKHATPKKKPITVLEAFIN